MSNQVFIPVDYPANYGGYSQTASDYLQCCYMCRDNYLNCMAVQWVESTQQCLQYTINSNYINNGPLLPYLINSDLDHEVGILIMYEISG